MVHEMRYGPEIRAVLILAVLCPVLGAEFSVAPYSSSGSGCSSGGARPFQALEQLFLAHVLDRDLGVVGIDRAARAPAISGTLSASGSSTSTYFCSEWIRSSLRSSGDTV